VTSEFEMARTVLGGGIGGGDALGPATCQKMFSARAPWARRTELPLAIVRVWPTCRIHTSVAPPARIRAMAGQWKAINAVHPPPQTPGNLSPDNFGRPGTPENSPLPPDNWTGSYENCG